MDNSSDSYTSGSRPVHHKIWTKRGERHFNPGQIAHITESEKTSDDSSVDGPNDADLDYTTVRNEQESIISGAGNLDRIIGVVSSYWDGRESAQPGRLPSLGELRKSLPSEMPSLTMRPPQDDRVGYLDPSRSFVSMPVELPPIRQSAPQVSHHAPPSSASTSTANRVPPPHEVPMITHSDSIPRPDLPVPPAPALPTLPESPLALLTAASGGKLDLEWLESFDNATLETLVPRDPHTGRPLTIGSIEHGQGTCRPCIFFLKAKCFKGLRCSFSHLTHATLRKPADASSSPFDLQALLFPKETAAAAAAAPTQSGGAKSKRLRPSKRTREMIKQINEQMMFDEIQEDPNGPPLCISQTNRAAMP